MNKIRDIRSFFKQTKNVVASESKASEDVADGALAFDSTFNEFFIKPNNMCSPTIQNELIQICANAVPNQITQKVRECGFFFNGGRSQML